VFAAIIDADRLEELTGIGIINAAAPYEMLRGPVDIKTIYLNFPQHVLD
jgi:hypothetical protein